MDIEIDTTATLEAHTLLLGCVEVFHDLKINQSVVTRCVCGF